MLTLFVTSAISAQKSTLEIARLAKDSQFEIEANPFAKSAIRHPRTQRLIAVGLGVFFASLYIFGALTFGVSLLGTVFFWIIGLCGSPMRSGTIGI